MLIGGFSQEYIYLHMCVLDYEQNGIATVCNPARMASPV